MTRAWVLALLIPAALLAMAARDLGPEGSARAAEAKGGALDPLGPNAGCYVCHMTFVREEVSKTHLAAKVACIKCHGLSAKHANDEDIGATKPDRFYPRDKVNRMCRKCHRTHDVPPEAVVARFLDRNLTESPPVCTDCHGTHRLARVEPATSP